MKLNLLHLLWFSKKLLRFFSKINELPSCPNKLALSGRDMKNDALSLM